MTPLDPTGGDPQQASERVARTLEILTTAAGLLGMLWAFLAKVAKPFVEWRREAHARTIRAVLAPELRQLNDLISDEDGCTQRMQRVINHQEAVLEEFDLVIGIVTDTRDRQDETSELLDEVFALDRRIDPDRRLRVERMFQSLHERRLARRREVG